MRILNQIKLSLQQKQINRQYKKDGLTDEILDKQIALNTKRHELDIPDGSKKINGKYVQQWVDGRLTNRKSVDNVNRLRNLKLASLKFKESQLQLQIKNGIDDKTVAQTMTDISNLKAEIQKLK